MPNGRLLSIERGTRSLKDYELDVITKFLDAPHPTASMERLNSIFNYKYFFKRSKLTRTTIASSSANGIITTAGFKLNGKLT